MKYSNPPSRCPRLSPRHGASNLPVLPTLSFWGAKPKSIIGEMERFGTTKKGYAGRGVKLFQHITFDHKAGRVTTLQVGQSLAVQRRSTLERELRPMAPTFRWTMGQVLKSLKESKSQVSITEELEHEWVRDPRAAVASASAETSAPVLVPIGTVVRQRFTVNDESEWFYGVVVGHATMENSLCFKVVFQDRDTAEYAVNDLVGECDDSDEHDMGRVQVEPLLEASIRPHYESLHSVSIRRLRTLYAQLDGGNRKAVFFPELCVRYKGGEEGFHGLLKDAMENQDDSRDQKFDVQDLCVALTRRYMALEVGGRLAKGFIEAAATASRRINEEDREDADSSDGDDGEEAEMGEGE